MQYSLHVSAKTRFLNTIRKLFRNQVCEQFLIEKNNKSNGNSVFAGFVPPEYIYQKPSWRQYERNKAKFKLDISNVVDHYTYFGFYDKGFENLKNKIKDNFCVVDIGANIGITAVHFANAANKVHVICFEPSADNYRRLVEHIALNELPNVITINKGVGENGGTYKLYNVVETNPGMKRILLNAKAEDEFEYEVIVISTLESELKEHRIEKVDLIKIDVEGFEFEVLKSAKGIIKKDSPILFIELDDNNLKENTSSAAAVVEFIRSLGYEVFFAASLEPLPDNYNFKNCHFDILCEPLHAKPLNHRTEER